MAKWFSQKFLQLSMCLLNQSQDVFSLPGMWEVFLRRSRAGFMVADRGSEFPQSDPGQPLFRKGSISSTNVTVQSHTVQSHSHTWHLCLNYLNKM